jgi:hypothetical protein
MPLIDFSSSEPSKSNGPKGWKAALGVAVLLGASVLGTTLASNISLNNGANVEFGQGVATTTACDSDGILITPTSGFVNSQGGGSHVLTSITVADIDSSSAGCQNKYLTIKAYGNSSSNPLEIVSGVTLIPVSVNSTNPVFSIETTTGISIAGNSTSFSLVIDPTASPIESGSISKFTLESSDTSPIQPLLYQIGETGTGGGTIFYRSATAFTSQGSACGDNCHYLEFAPKGWASLTDWPNNVGYNGHDFGPRANVYEDPYLVWSDGNFVNESPGSIAVGTNIGTGFQNTQQILANTITEGKSPRYSFVAALNYVGASGSSTAGQWFLPSIQELNELCKYARGQVSSLGNTSVQCSKSGTTLDTNLGFNEADNIYLSSSYGVVDNGFIAGYKIVYGADPAIGSYYAVWGGRVRPVRAF